MKFLRPFRARTAGMLAGLFLVCLAASAQPLWLTVVGDPADPKVDTVLVDPSPIGPAGLPERLLRIRVNRAAERPNWEGRVYRSYDAIATFRCREKGAWVRSFSFYTRPLWQGEPGVRITYGEENMPQLLFRDMNPNPLERLVRAACN